jgi:SAM-dependent methyltransferase
MVHAGHRPAWESGPALDRFIGRWSRLVAREFLAWLEVGPALRWFDAGCGAGALSQTIVAHAAPRWVAGLDRSPMLAAYARHQIPERCVFLAGDATALPFKTHVFDVVTAALLLNFIPEPAMAVAEMRRVAQPGGTVAAYVWDYAGGMQMLRLFWDVAGALDPVARDLDEGRRFPLCHPTALAHLFSTAGLRDVATRPIDVPTTFEDFDDYWVPFLGGQGPAPTYVMSLSDQLRVLLRERLREILPVGPNGSIALTARAWAVRATS